MASSKRDRQRSNRPLSLTDSAAANSSAEGGHQSKPTGGTWVWLAELDPAWVYKEVRRLLRTARPVTGTDRSMMGSQQAQDLVLTACGHLPFDLRPAPDVEPDLRWKRGGGGFLLVCHISDEITDVVGFERGVKMVGYARLWNTNSRAELTMYKDGARVNLQTPIFAEGYPDSAPVS